MIADRIRNRADELRADSAAGMPVNDPFSHIFRSLRRLVEEGPAAWELGRAEKQPFRLLVANTPELRERAYRLGARIYQKMGYVSAATQCLVGRHDARTDTFVLLVVGPDGQDAATLTLVFDSDEDGLPLDDIYRNEADRLRARGRRLTEMVRLAVDDSIRGNRDVLVHLFNFTYIYARRVRHCDDIVVTVNPHHAAYYRRLLGFEQVGGEKSCSKVNDAPAVLLRLPLEIPAAQISKSGGRLERNAQDRSLYPFFYTEEAEPFIAAFLKHRHHPMEAAEAARFGLKTETTV